MRTIESDRQHQAARSISPRERLHQAEARERDAGRGCTCYVRTLPDVDRFGLRFGAHALTCPQHRASLDPVDAIHDAATRDHYTATRIRQSIALTFPEHGIVDVIQTIDGRTIVVLS